MSIVAVCFVALPAAIWTGAAAEDPVRLSLERVRSADPTAGAVR